ncbi:MAG: hypothetical protein A3K18_05995 [Lentisphaerae bacterium RIFOXYA12_64_32]|nr:MAG: hypothetical protein A3K18_05995 [Lentisphaerae bacterium RIFOXYA12_64_32]
MRERLRSITPNLAFFLLGIAFLGMAGGMFETTFNNFVHDAFSLDADRRGFLEFPRELPGFLTALFAGLLFFLPETRIGAVCGLMVGAGMFGLAFCGQSWNAMLLFTIVWSIGMHLLMPISSSVGMALATGGRKGRRLGQVRGVSIASSIIGCALVWWVMRDGRTPNYRLIFIMGGTAATLAGVALMFIRMPDAHLERPKFVWNNRYWLYYVLSFLFGARKQIFITFGPWVLVKIFHQPVVIFAKLWMVAAVLGIAFQPLLGRAIDRLGERFVLMTDSVCIFLVCAGYGFAHLLHREAAALGLLYVCFVADQLLFGVNMARDTYLSKIAVRPEDVAPTLSFGITLNHAVSMSIPSLGGLMWMRYGHSSVFLGAAVIAVVMLFFTSQVRVPASAPAQG